MSGFIIGIAFILDLLIGDPANWPHPVVIIGRAIDKLAGQARARYQKPNQLKNAGIAIVVIIVGLTLGITALILFAAYELAPIIGAAVAVILAYTTLAARGLYSQTWRVAVTLRDGNLPLAREQLGMVVGRDTSELDGAGIYRALIETIAENLSDGVIAPLFYLALGGPALAMGYKAASTLDSMIGYKDERYKDLGWAAARLDDVLNYVPARLSALLIALAARILGLDYKESLDTWKKEGHRHSSPNAGQPEAAIAGALGVQLGGASVYRGELVEKPTLGQARYPIDELKVRRAEEIMIVSSGIMVLAAVLVRSLIQYLM